MPALEIVALDTATPQLEVPQSGDTYSAPRALAISPQSLTGASATTSLDITQTWNTTGTPTAVKLNVTDTASAAGSLLADLQVGGTSRFNVTKNGLVQQTPSAREFGGFLSNFLGGNTGFTCGASNIWYWILVGVPYMAFRSTSLTLLNRSLGFTGTTVSSDAPDLLLERDAANTLAQRNATNAQTLRVYNTYTSATNYERAKIAWDTNVLKIGTEKGSGGGTARALELQTDATTRLTVGESGGVTIADANDVAVGTTTGTKIGTATSQKLGFWNATPIVQPTTAVAAATVAATGIGDVVAASTTFDGYTIPQIVKALRNAGLLA